MGGLLQGTAKATSFACWDSMADGMDDFEEMEPTIEEILSNKNYKWIFAGGKGGVGKTTSSCSIALELAKTRESVLIISTDPAHNLADAFNQKIESTPTKIEGVDNLYAMEVSAELNKEGMSSMLGDAADQFGLGSLMEDLGSAMPGIDEAMSFAEVIKLVVSLDFSVVVFDTAPTGHTLRFLSFPDILEKGLAKMNQMKGQFGGLFQQFSSMMGVEGSDQMDSKLEQTRSLTAQVNAQFKDPNLTTFVCVCIPEFLSLYETERLLQQLAKFHIDSHTIIINQILYPEKGGDCGLCKAREAMQQKYIGQLELLYPDFHIVKMPLMKEEIRGIDKLHQFSAYLKTPYS